MSGPDVTAAFLSQSQAGKAFRRAGSRLQVGMGSGKEGGAGVQSLVQKGPIRRLYTKGSRVRSIYRDHLGVCVCLWKSLLPALQGFHQPRERRANILISVGIRNTENMLRKVT